MSPFPAPKESAGRSVTGTSMRLSVLDGVRGWAALSVVLFHIFWETFGIIYPPFRNGFTAFFFNGPLAVFIFFVLSGEALSAGYFSGKGPSAVARLAIGRYTRLTIPILASCIVVFCLLWLGVTPNHQAAVIVHRQDWLGAFVQFEPNLERLLRYGLIDVYTPVAPTDAYNPFLWTMRVELAGSALVFTLLFLDPFLRRPVTLYALLTAGLWAWGSELACFPAGMMIARARQRHLIEAAQNHRHIVITATFCLLAIAGVYAVITFTPFARLILNARAMMAAAIAILLCIFVIKPLSSFFADAAISKFLGKLSFPLYLVQFPVLISLTSTLIVSASFQTGQPSTSSIWLISMASLAACIAAAVIFKPIERLTRFVGSTLVRLVIKQQQ
jgi:peptidoglycan/LPS O-acetylase OafA/YrhL